LRNPLKIMLRSARPG